MRFKIDENLHQDAADVLIQNGHDALTVHDQGLRGHADTDLADVCKREGRTMITLDLDFANMLAYLPANYPGIIVLRLADQSRAAVVRVLTRIVPDFGTQPIAGHLWIVDEYHVRIRGADPNVAP